MREDLNNILAPFCFEILDDRTAYEITHILERYLQNRVDHGIIVDFHVTNETTPSDVDENSIHFRIQYNTRPLVNEITIIDLTLGSGTATIVMTPQKQMKKHILI